MSAPLPPDLARLLAAADESARESTWDAFLASYSRLLLHAARVTSTDHDLAMDAYAFILEALREDGFRRLRAYAPLPGSKFTTWLVMVARRLCVDYVRKRYGQPRGEGEAGRHLRLVRARLADLLADDVDPDRLSHPGEDRGPDNEVRAAELGQLLTSALAQLEPPDRLLLTLRFDDGRTAREIAAIMRFPTVFHVYRRLNAVLLVLRDSLRRRGVEDSSP